jgi:colanic acid/amylovoran biosynthesis glycosyltransferase
LEKAEVHVIHAHFAWLSASAAMVIGRLLDLPFTVTSHACDIYSPENDLLCLIAQTADRLITISNYNRQAIIDLCPQIAQEKIAVIHCGIDLDQFQSVAIPQKNATFNILSVGSLVEKKGHEYLIQACWVLKEQGLNFHCTIVGRGERQMALEQLIADLNVADVVTLAGAQEQPGVREKLRSSDVFVLACVVAQNNDRDGIPVAMMEALAMGVPVVSTYVSGVPELIQHQQNGLLVPERDSEALAAAIMQLAKDKTWRQRLSVNGRASVTSEFDIRKNAQRLVDLFHRVVQENMSDA